MIRILYATDFSPAAQSALDYIIHLAGDLGATLDVIHIYKIPPLHSEADFTNMDTVLQEIKAAAEEKLNELTSGIPSEILNTSSAIFGMFIPQEIVCYADKNNIDMIALGAKGEHNVLEHMLGSVTTHTMLSSPVPVLSIPDKATYRAIKRIAYATDLNPKSFLPIATLKKIADRLGAELRIVNVKKDIDLPDMSDKSSYILENISNFPVDIIVNPSVEEGLNNYIQTKEVDWLSLFIPRRRLWERIFHHSLSKQMFFHAHVPLLIYKE